MGFSAKTMAWILAGIFLGAMGGAAYLLVSGRWLRYFAPRTMNSLQTINIAERQYAENYGGSFSPSLAALGTGAATYPQPTTCPEKGASSSAACLIDGVLTSGLKSGYRITYEPGEPDSHGVIRSYVVHEDPSPYAIKDSTMSHYFTSEDGVIRVEKGRPATKNSAVWKDDQP